MRRDVAKTKNCHITGKVSYRDAKSARQALKNVTRAVAAGALLDTGVLPTREYRCNFCGHYHLTSKEEE